MEFVFLLILLLCSVAAQLLIRLKIEQSIFFSICVIFIIMFFSGIAANLLAGFYIIIGISGISLAYIIYKSVKKDIKTFELITPGSVIFVIAFCVYYFSTQGALLHLWDEATHWGTAAKKMYYSNGLWTSGLQAIATPLFNQVMLRLTGYKESALYLSQWTLYLSCVILPLSGINWKKSYLAAIYSAAVIFAVSSVFQYGNLTLYADGLLSFFFASLILAWYLEKERSFKRYIWAGAGLFMLVQIKSGSGMSLAFMFAAFALFSDAVLNPLGLPSKKVYLKNLKTLSIFASLILASNFLFGAVEKSLTGADGSAAGISKELSSSAVFIICAALSAVTFVLFAVYTINVFAKKPIAPVKPVNRLLIVSASLAFAGLLGVLFFSTFLRPDFVVKTAVINFIAAFKINYALGLPMMYLILIIIALYIINSAIARKEEKASYIGFYWAALIFSGLYILGTLYAYLSSFGFGEAVNTASFDRYVGTGIMFALMLAFMPLLKQSGATHKKIPAPQVVMFVCAALLAVSFTPSFIATQKTAEEAFTFRQTEIAGANQVKALVGSDKKVFLVIQGDGGFVFHWMRYEFLPIATNGGYWSFGIGGGWDFSWNEAKMKQFLHDAHYDYLYLFDSNDYFVQRFAPLFGENPPESRTLYKFDYDGETVFTPVR